MVEVEWCAFSRVFDGLGRESLVFPVDKVELGEDVRVFGGNAVGLEDRHSHGELLADPQMGCNKTPKKYPFIPFSALLRI